LIDELSDPEAQKECAAMLQDFERKARETNKISHKVFAAVIRLDFEEVERLKALEE
jgi:hypothetical protein